MLIVIVANGKMEDFNKKITTHTLTTINTINVSDCFPEKHKYALPR